MANIHVLQQTAPGRFRVVFHFAVPGTNNAAGVAWQTIIAREFGKTVLPDGDGTGGTISAAEKAQIVSGALVEVVAEEKGQSGSSLNAIFAARQSAEQARLQALYAQYGRTF